VEVRAAGPAEAGVVARLLHDFNVEFATPTPGPAVLEARLGAMLAGDCAVALLAGEPAVAVALLTFRPSVWDAGPVALLEELYVRPDLRGRRIGQAVLERALAVARERGSETFEINVDEDDAGARRFYEAHGFANTEPGSTERLLYYWRAVWPQAALGGAAPGGRLPPHRSQARSTG
jgi:GNAT superfamily N-acetyltransferase